MHNMSLVSLVVLAGLILNIIYYNRHEKIFVAALAAKIMAGFCLGILYKYYLGGGDTFQYFYEAKTIVGYLLEHPSAWYPLFFNTTEVVGLAGQVVYYDQPRALLFAKIISMFYLFSGGNYWIISAFLGLINLLCIRQLVRELNMSFPGYSSSFAIAFYFLPTFVFWTSGLLKEGLAIAALGILVMVALRYIRTRLFVGWYWLLAALVCLVVLWQLKYYYAALVVPVLGSLTVFFMIKKKKGMSPVVLVVIFAGGILVASSLHYNLSLTRVLEVVYENHEKAISKPGQSAIRYPRFDGSLAGFLFNMPLALFSGLFRPMFFEVKNVFQAMAMAENLMVLLALLWGMWKSKMRLPLQNPFVLATLIYVTSLAVLLAFAAPNLGTLSRYKVAYWPFFVVLVAMLCKKNFKPQGISHK